MTASFNFYHNQFIQFLFTIIIVYYKKIRFLNDIFYDIQISINNLWNEIC